MVKIVIRTTSILLSFCKTKSPSVDTFLNVIRRSSIRCVHKEQLGLVGVYFSNCTVKFR